MAKNSRLQTEQQPSTSSLHLLSSWFSGMKSSLDWICMMLQVGDLNAGLHYASLVLQEISTWGHSHVVVLYPAPTGKSENHTERCEQREKCVCSVHCVILDKHCAVFLPCSYVAMYCVSLCNKTNRHDLPQLTLYFTKGMYSSTH